MLRWLLVHIGAGYAQRHPLRTGVQVLAIALGVALGFAINRINASALDEFSGAVRQVLGQADFTINGGRTGFDDALVDRIAALPDVETASPIVEIEAPVPALPRSAAGRGTLRVLGVDIFRAALLAPALIGEPGSTSGGNRLEALLGDGLFLSPAALARLGLNVGDELQLQVGARVESFRIAGTLPAVGNEQELAVLDIAAAQLRFGELRRVHRVDIQLAASSSPAAARERIQSLLPPGVDLTTPDEATQRVSNISRAYRVNLNVLALVALFTGAFLVFSLQAQAVITRRVELAFLRVLGLTSRELQRLLVIEAIVTG
ncbi:MAG: ABC transporter permease, partial [Burkholderiaceae bacterium]